MRNAMVATWDVSSPARRRWLVVFAVFLAPRSSPHCGPCRQPSRERNPKSAERDCCSTSRRRASPTTRAWRAPQRRYVPAICARRSTARRRATSCGAAPGAFGFHRRPLLGRRRRRAVRLARRSTRRLGTRCWRPCRRRHADRACRAWPRACRPDLRALKTRARPHAAPAPSRPPISRAVAAHGMTS